jgi:hypothetical protein
MPGNDRAAGEDARRREWHRYYARKRAPQQHGQLDLLGMTDACRVLEIGPYLGYVTALLCNAGYAAETFDLSERLFDTPDVPHHRGDLTRFDPARFDGRFDAILCCETLEHIPFAAAARTLARFAETDARHLIVSVPWSGMHLRAALTITPRAVSSLLSLHWTRRYRRFVPEPDPLGHKWELGYRGTPLGAWEAAIRRAGWRIRERRFTEPIRSVMHLCENVSRAAAGGGATPAARRASS